MSLRLFPDTGNSNCRQAGVLNVAKHTLQHLGELGAANTQEARMSVEEIAVQIMKGASDVENH